MVKYLGMSLDAQATYPEEFAEWNERLDPGGWAVH